MEHIEALFTRHPWIESIFDRCFRVVVIIAIVLGCAKLIHVICKRILEVAHHAKSADGRAAEREKRVATVVGLIETALRVLLFGAAFLMVLREVGVDITPLLTGAGIAGVAVGFGAQSLVKDVISGFFILLEDQIRVGDVIKINSGLSGSVERMELRVTAIRDGDGTLHIIPNGEIKSVSNMTYEFGNAVVDLPIPYATDMKRVSEALSGVVGELWNDSAIKPQLFEKPQFLGITGFSPTHMTVTLVAKTLPHSRWSIDREIRARAKQALDRAGVELLKPAVAVTSKS